jgi:hypothetical protein
METEKPKRVYTVSTVLPNNERVRNKLERERQKEEERLRDENDKKKKQLENNNLEEIMRKQQQEDKLKEKQEQEFEQDTKLRVALIFKNLKQNLIKLFIQNYF